MTEEVLTKHGKEKFADNGFLYIFDKTKKADSKLKFWYCVQKYWCIRKSGTKLAGAQTAAPSCLILLHR